MLAPAGAQDRVREFQAICIDDAAFNAWYDDAAPRIFAFALARCSGDRALAEELTQAAFIRAIRARDRYDGRASVTTWICSIVRNLLVDHHRKLEREERSRLRLTVRAVDAEEPATRIAERDAVLDALRNLPAMQRMALILRYVDQYSIEEVAQALGKSEAATHSLLTRSRDRFRARFGGRTR